MAYLSFSYVRNVELMERSGWGMDVRGFKHQDKLLGEFENTGTGNHRNKSFCNLLFLVLAS